MLDAFEDHCWKDLVGEDILKIYSVYKRETYIGKKPVLLAVDLYNLVFAGGPHPVEELQKEFPSSCGIYAWNALKPLQELFAVIRSKKIPVIYSTTDTREEAKPKLIKPTNRRKNVFDQYDYEIKQEIRPESNDIIIYKQRASCFFGTPLISYLTQMKTDSLIVCGESTSGCIRATVVDAYSYGLHTVIVEECCFDRIILSHKINLFDLHHKYADVMHLNELKMQLNGL